MCASESHEFKESSKIMLNIGKAYRIKIKNEKMPFNVNLKFIQNHHGTSVHPSVCSEYQTDLLILHSI